MKRFLNISIKCIFKNKNEDFYYEFDFKLDSQEISLSLFKRSKEEKEEVLVLDHQSEGFRWYFDLFFNLLCSSHLKPNSIVIIDEGFSKLSAPTCIECHNFLKKLGQDKRDYFCDKHAQSLFCKSRLFR
nr:hypothetical protein [Helicobacter pylori]